jgi:hypothetical protein
MTLSLCPSHGRMRTRAPGLSWLFAIGNRWQCLRNWVDQIWSTQLHKRKVRYGGDEHIHWRTDGTIAQCDMADKAESPATGLADLQFCLFRSMRECRSDMLSGGGKSAGKSRGTLAMGDKVNRNSKSTPQMNDSWESVTGRS